MNGPNWVWMLGTLPGLVALIGAAIGYGRLQARLSNVERDVEKLGTLADTVTRIDERTKTTASSLEKIETGLSRVSDWIMSGALNFIRDSHHNGPPGR